MIDTFIDPELGEIEMVPTGDPREKTIEKTIEEKIITVEEGLPDNSPSA